MAVAISWGDYFTTLLRGVGADLPAWLTTGYRTALLSSNPDVRGLLDTAPQFAGVPLLVNLPAFGIVMLVTWLLLRGARESASANNVMVVIKLLALGLFIAVGLMNIDPANYTPFAPNGFTGIHQGAASCSSRTSASTPFPPRRRKRRIRSATCRSDPRRAASVRHYVIVGAVLTAWSRTVSWASRTAVAGARAHRLSGVGGWLHWGPSCR